MPWRDASLLMNARAVRERSHMILEAGLEGRLTHFVVHEDQLDACADYVADTILTRYPSLDVPPHARWRHFVVNGEDRWQTVSGTLSHDRAERARQRFELVIMSVLLDAGAGPAWRYTWRDERGLQVARRSEGLAIASLNAWAEGLFTSMTGAPQTDGRALRALTTANLGRAFQVTPDNPLEGLDGRVALLNRLGQVATVRQEVFGTSERLGLLFDLMEHRARMNGGSLPAPTILNVLLDVLGPIWPGRLDIDRVPLGDTWRHPAITVPGPTKGLIPFHKLSQWLAYSLVEPLEEAGVTVSDIDGLTGLAEYRNGGLFIDTGVITPRDSALLTTPLDPGHEAVVEWRALTVALIDSLAPRIFAAFGPLAKPFTLASILEGGTWAAGRRIAAEKRPGGAPPITIISDGSVF